MRQAAFAAVVKDDQVLLVRSLTSQNFRDHWSLPGGLVDPGELPIGAAQREVLEETGVQCSIDRLIMKVNNTAEDLEVSLFAASYKNGQIRLQVHEIADGRWFSFAEAEDLPLAYNTAEILQSLRP